MGQGLRAPGWSLSSRRPLLRARLPALGYAVLSRGLPAPEGRRAVDSALRQATKEIPLDARLRHTIRRRATSSRDCCDRGGRRLSRRVGVVLSAAEPGPEGHPRLGAWLRRRRGAPGGPRMGRAGGDALADHPGGREDRPVWLRGHGAVLLGPQRPGPAAGQRGALLGGRGHRHVDHGNVAGGGGDLRAGNERADRRMDSALLRRPGRRQGRGLLRLRARRGLGHIRGAHECEVRRERPRVGHQRPEGVGDERRHRRRARRDRLGRSRSALARARGLRRADERGQRDLAGLEGVKARPAGLAYRRRLPR